ncbi:MAG: hypothetical protein ACXAEN_25105 [Candidatus Thorarchaeota archaeon]|jgi:hypothetical protein
MADSVYNNYKALAMSGVIDLSDGGVYVMLVSGTYHGYTQTNKRGDTLTGDIPVGDQVVGDGYTVGGEKLTNPAITISLAGATEDNAVFDADDVSWTTSTITASGAVIWHSGGSPATSYLLAFVDFGQDQVSTNGTFQILWNNDGIFNLTDV